MSEIGRRKYEQYPWRHSMFGVPTDAEMLRRVADIGAHAEDPFDRDFCTAVVELGAMIGAVYELLNRLLTAGDDGQD